MENSEIDLSGYMMFIHPNVEFDLLNDTELKTLMQYNANNKILQKGYVGEIHGCQIMKSTLVPTYTGQGSGGANVYPCLLVAQHAFGIVDVAGKGKMEAIVKALGSGGTSDPLNQRATIGWKAYQAPLILNNNFMIRIEVGCTVG
jgi:N4-gp56 family major capsid protein